MQTVCPSFYQSPELGVKGSGFLDPVTSHQLQELGICEEGPGRLGGTLKCFLPLRFPGLTSQDRGSFCSDSSWHSTSQRCFKVGIRGRSAHLDKAISQGALPAASPIVCAHTQPWCDPQRSEQRKHDSLKGVREKPRAFWGGQKPKLLTLKGLHAWVVQTVTSCLRTLKCGSERVLICTSHTLEARLLGPCCDDKTDG